MSLDSKGHDRERPALLLIGCSRKKSPHLQRGPAWDLYDGPLFQVLKKALRGRPEWEATITVRIVSARYGLIEPQQVISTYNERLTSKVAQLHGDLWARQLREVVLNHSFRAVHVNLGRDYLSVLPNLDTLFGATPLDRATGGIGVRNAQSRRWLLTQLDNPIVDGANLSDETAAPRLSR